MLFLCVAFGVLTPLLHARPPALTRACTRRWLCSRHQSNEHPTTWVDFRLAPARRVHRIEGVRARVLLLQHVLKWITPDVQCMANKRNAMFRAVVCSAQSCTLRTKHNHTHTHTHSDVRIDCIIWYFFSAAFWVAQRDRRPHVIANGNSRECVCANGGRSRRGSRSLRGIVPSIPVTPLRHATRQRRARAIAKCTINPRDARSHTVTTYH